MGDEVGGKEPGHAGQHPGRIHVSPSSATTNACTTERSRSPATTATAPFTPGHPATAASTSPSSTLWPRIFTCCWESLRPRNSKTAPGQ